MSKFRNIFILIVILILVGVLIWFALTFFKTEEPEVPEGNSLGEKEEEKEEEKTSFEYISDAPYLKKIEGLEINGVPEVVESNEDFTEEFEGGDEGELEDQKKFVAGSYQDMDYEIRGGGAFVKNGVKEVTYNVIVGNLDENQTELLAEGIIEDIVNQDSDIVKINLLFLSSLESKTVDVARILWEEGEMLIVVKD